jgi:hypothetical protein
MAIEKLQKDSEIPLEPLKQDIIGALEAEKEGAAPSAPDDNPIATEVMSKAMGGSIFAAAMEVRNDLASSNNNSNSIFVGGMNKKQQGSIFVGGGSAGNNKATHARTPLVPPSYSEKKEAARKTPAKPERDADIFARSRLSGMSLTGSSATGGKSTPPKGVSATAATAKALKLAELQQQLSVVNQTILNPYDNSSKRLMNDLSKGVDKAEVFVQRNPEKIRSTTQQTQSR